MNRIKILLTSIILSVLIISTASAQNPAYKTFLFTFEASDGGPTATGCISLAGAAIEVPFDFVNLSTGSSMIQALSVTVSGAQNGNGTFGIEDIGAIHWQSNGALLNLDQELVGQPTDDDPWGTPSDGNGGDFNLFGSAPGAPIGQWYFELHADEGSDPAAMILTSMIAGESEECVVSFAQPVPVLSQWSKITLFLLLASMAAFTIRRRFS